MSRYSVITLALVNVFVKGQSEIRYITEANVTISSPSFPNPYPPDQFIEWKANLGTLTKLTLNLTYLSLEMSEGCKFDGLFITDISGEHVELGPLCGNLQPDINLTASLLSYGYGVRFKSDESLEYQGFSLQVTGIPVPQQQLCDDMHDIQAKRISSSLVNLADFYPTGLNCSWDLSSVPNKTIDLEFKRFDLQYSGPNCPFDRFEIWNICENTSLVDKYCGRIRPWAMSTDFTNIRLTFLSDDLDNSGGFLIMYNFSFPSNTPYKPSTRKYLMLTPEPKSESFLREGFSNSLHMSLIFRTHPGFFVELQMETWPRYGFQVHGGPYETSPKVRLPIDGGKISIFYFHVIAKLDLSVLKYSTFSNITFRCTARNPEFFLYRDLTSLSFYTQKLRVTPNNENCAHAGFVLYKETFGFGNFIAVICDVQKHYSNIVNMLYGSNVVMLFYSYSDLSSVIFLYPNFSGSCRAYFLTNWINPKPQLLYGDSYKIQISLIDHNLVTDITYQEAPNECIVVHMIPLSATNFYTGVDGDVDLNFNLNGNFTFDLCKWSSQNSVNGRTNTEVSKYGDGLECTRRNGGHVASHRVKIMSGWSNEYIRLQIGKGSDKLCGDVMGPWECPQQIIRLSCGTLSFNNVECVRKVVLHSLERPGKYYWVVEIDTVLRGSHGQRLEISEELRSMELTTATEIYPSRMFIGYWFLGNFQYFSMRDVDLTISISDVKPLIYFDSLPLEEMEKIVLNASGEDGVCYEKQCYIFRKNSSPTSWLSAREACKETGGDLVSINSNAELKFLQRALATAWFQDFYGTNRGLVFIGLHNLNKDKSYFWVDESALKSSDWYYPFQLYRNVLPYDPHPPMDLQESQPSADSFQRCVAMVPGNLGFSTNWRKVRCQELYTAQVYSICEHSVNITGTAGTDDTANITGSTDPPSYLHCDGNWNLAGNTCLMIRGLAWEQYHHFYHYKVETCSWLKGKLPSSASFGQIYALFGGTRVKFYVASQSGDAGCVSLDMQNNTVVAYGCKIMELLHTICEKAPSKVELFCEPYQFTCGDRTCLNPDLVCDGEEHCLHGEDELNCNLTTHAFACGDGKKIPISKVCDYRVDCPDSRDEHCIPPDCPPGPHYRCENGECVPEHERCDGKADCLDASDEQACDFESQCNGFTCPVSGCIPKNRVNDLQPDCPDNTAEDEVGAGVSLLNMCLGTWGKVRCEIGHRKCFPVDKACVYDHDKYGMVKYCRNGAHLEHCEMFKCPNMFKCPKSFCVEYHEVCDGVADCPNGEDELRCGETSCPGRLKCGSSAQCVSLSEVCDGEPNCNNWSDEKFCDLKDFTCPLNCSCIEYRVYCERSQLLHVPEISVKLNIRVFDLRNNHITLANDKFDGFHFLVHLYLQQNRIDTLAPAVFRPLVNLRVLDLSYNNLKAITSSLFEDLSALQFLSLHGNPIHSIPDNTFKQADYVRNLNLSNMLLTSISFSTFAGLDNIESLDLSHNIIQTISKGSFETFGYIGNLFLYVNPLNSTGPESLITLKAKVLHTDFSPLCCYVGDGVGVCLPESDLSHVCTDLLNTTTIKVITWVTAILALIGNIFVIGRRVYKKLPDVPSVFIFNLALSDLLMGLYLLLLAVVDLTFTGSYALYDISWRSSQYCKAIGAIGFISCEMSMYTLVLIALDRTKQIAFPFSPTQFDRKGAFLIEIVGWGLCILLSVFPLLIPSYFGDFYGRNSICLPFNFTEPKGPGWEFTTFIFVGLNTVGLILIVSMYVLIFHRVRESRRRSGRTCPSEISVARKLSIVVFTDLICVLPIIITNGVAISGRPIDRGLSATIVAVLLPINSALNPFLFTLWTMEKRAVINKILRRS